MRMSAKEEQANFYFECGSKAQASTVGDLLQVCHYIRGSRICCSVATWTDDSSVLIPPNLPT